jgi:hypothetical protein
VPLQDAIFTAKSGVMLSMNSKTKEITRTKVANAEPLGTHEVTRRIKRYARLAGIRTVDASLRTVLHTHKMLVDLYPNSDKLAEVLGLKVSASLQTQVPALRPAPVQAGSQAQSLEWSPARGSQATQRVRDRRLHGIGRRNKSVIATR